MALVGIIAQRPWAWKTAAREAMEALGYNAPRDPMSLIQAHDLHKSYGDRDVLNGVDLALARQARIALVGPNGIGKTTLLRILAGRELPDDGEIHRARDLRIGYLPQEPAYEMPTRGDETIWEFCLEAFQALRRREAELAELEKAMADPKLVDQAIKRYGALQEAFEREGGYAYEARIRQVLTGLGIPATRFSTPLRFLSGGERTRLQLARLLLEDPELLILDEPTNHLDIMAVEWLERWLADWPGTAIMVSHDRYFLDRVADGVWELTASGIQTYRGNYSAYVEQREAREHLQQERFEAQQALIRKEQEFIRRNIAGQKTRQAQGRRKCLDRMLQKEALERPRKAETARIQFRQPDRSGDRVLETSGLVIGHGDAQEVLFSAPDLVLRRGECVALIGPNGAGKTTLLRTLLAEIPPLAGSVKVGAAVQVGYFEQAHAGLDPAKTPLEEILETAPDLRLSQARSYLAGFLFRGDEVHKRVRALSGGERSRLALAKLILEGANFLLLDEPTNHLDIPSQEALEEALRRFEGTVLLVSHDRYLIEALATQVWAISPDEKSLTVVQGGYEAFLERQRTQRAARKDVQTARGAPARQARARVGPSLDALEEKIHTLEVEMESVSRALEQAGEDVDQVVRLGERYAALQEALEAQLTLWERLAREASTE